MSSEETAPTRAPDEAPSPQAKSPWLKWAAACSLLLLAAGVAGVLLLRQYQDARAEQALAQLQDLLQADRYEQVLEGAQRLLRQSPERAAAHDLAGHAAFALGRWDVAEAHLTAARQAGALSGKGGQWLDGLPDSRIQWQQEAALRAAEQEADDLPRVRLVTTKGPLVVELLENEAPRTVANFVHLVEEGFYDGTEFHRVLPGFMMQGGAPRPGEQEIGWRIACECYGEDRRLHFRGALSMANAGRDTGSSHFFITFLPTPHLDGKHTVFGRVIEGMEVLAEIQRMDPQRPTTATPDRLLNAVVLRKRDHAYVPTKLPVPQEQP